MNFEEKKEEPLNKVFLINNIISFNIVYQYKLLYIIPTSGNRIYHIWFKNIEELDLIERFIRNKDNLKDFFSAILSSTSKVRKEFMPVPSFVNKQKDDFYHTYIKFSIDP